MGAIRTLTVKLLFSMLAFAAFAASHARAEDYASAQGYSHYFNNGVSVYTGVFALNKDISLDTSAYLRYNVDFINPSFADSASISGASSAVTSSGGENSDTRHAVTLGASHNFNNIFGAEIYFDNSTEKDYTSSTPTVTLKKDFFDKNTTLTLGYSRNMDEISGKFIGSTQGRTTDNYFLGVTQVISPVTVARLGYSRSESRGFESEGIRLVPLNGTEASSCTEETASCVDEVFPGERSREAYVLGVNHYFVEGLDGWLDKSSVRLNFRYYEDSWDMTSYAGEVEFYKYVTDRSIVRLNYRHYEQSKAYFVKDTYTGPEEFKSSSPQLQELSSDLAGIKLIYNFYMDDRDLFKSGAIEGKYEYYTESIGVNAQVLMAGIRLSF